MSQIIVKSLKSISQIQICHSNYDIHTELNLDFHLNHSMDHHPCKNKIPMCISQSSQCIISIQSVNITCQQRRRLITRNLEN